MTIKKYFLDTPIDAVLFDCDATLSKIEGIDYLAIKNGIGNRVLDLTQQAMGTVGLNPDLYEKRLALVKPTKAQLETLGKAYVEHMTQDASELISILTKLNKNIYLVTAGLTPSIRILAKALNVSEKNIFSVDVKFDEQGNYLDFDRQSPLITNHGKQDIVIALKNKHARIIHVGDGLNDLSVIDHVIRFIGFGGVVYRKNIEAAASYYVKSPSLLSVLPYLLTEKEYRTTLSPIPTCHKFV